MILSFVFFNDTATTEIYTLSLHDALPIWERTSSQGFDRGSRQGRSEQSRSVCRDAQGCATAPGCERCLQDRKSTRLNSSHANISYAVFCLKKIKKVNSLICTTLHMIVLPI